MAELKRTPLYADHVSRNANMVDFGGWEMPVNYEGGIVEEHLYTRKKAGLFDVSHMARFRVSGEEALNYLQYVLTNNALALDLCQAQYTMIPNENGGAVDDAYLYRFLENEYLLVVNAANRDKDWEHLHKYTGSFRVELKDISMELAMISIQGPMSRKVLDNAFGTSYLTEPVKNALNLLILDGMEVWVAKTGYTGEPLGFEIFAKPEDIITIWSKLIDSGAKPIGLGARDTLRLEAGLPLYGHELGLDDGGSEIPIFSVNLARFAVSFAEAKGDYVGREALLKQFKALQRILVRDFGDIKDLPKRIKPITLVERGVLRNGLGVYKDDVRVGTVTSGTMIPYYVTEGKGLDSKFTDEVGKRSIGLAYVNSDVIVREEVKVEIRGKMLGAVIPPTHLRGDAPPYARPIIHGYQEEIKDISHEDYKKKAAKLLEDSLSNHSWRGEECINLIPSEQVHSNAVRLLSVTDPSFRYAEHKKIKSFYDEDVFYYQGTKHIDMVEKLLSLELKKYFGCKEVETRVISGQMANAAVFSAMMDFKNRTNRKVDPKRLGYVMNNHIIRGGHLSSQPMGALHDYIAIDPRTEKHALVNFPVLRDNPFKMDVDATKDIISNYKPELLIFGKSMVIHREPIAEIRQFVDAEGINTTIMYDMAHVLGLVGKHFQDPFAEGAEIVTGSTHKTFFGSQRGVIAGNYDKEDFKYYLWQSIENRAFPGSVSNHHLGTMVGLLMAAYEMNCFRDEYQANVIANAKHLARALKDVGLDVAGDESIGFTETHQVVLRVGYAQGAELAQRLEDNNIVVNYQATPEEEGFTASGAIRMGVSEMTRFGFGEEEFKALAEIIRDILKEPKDVRDRVKALRKGYTEMKYCFSGDEIKEMLHSLAGTLKI